LIDPAYLDALRAIAHPIRAADMPRSLTPMRRLMIELGNPQTQFPSIVVTGSVGKGTTSHKIAHLLQQPYGEIVDHVPTKKDIVGLYTSPHLHSFRERFVINGEPISQPEFVEVANTVLEAASRLEFPYSTFELATALALCWFARRGVNIAVLEVGIGGRWDAVNVVENILSVFTSIEREHVAMLGGSLQTIAWNKAGIMRPGTVALSTFQSPIVEEVLRYEEKQNTARIIFVGDLAVAAYRYLVMLRKIPARKLDANLFPLPQQLPGRLEAVQIARRTVLIDGGHTPTSARHLRARVKQLVDNATPVRLIVGMLRDKSVRDFLTAFDLLPRDHLILTTAPGHRAFAPHELAAQADLKRASVEIVPDLNAAFAQIASAPESLMVVTGSLRMAAAAREAFGLLSPNELAEAQATRAIFDGEDYLCKLRHFR